MINQTSYKAIFVFWSTPMLSSDLKGYNKKRNVNSKIHLKDYELLVQKHSALSAKKHIGKTVLYTDTQGYNYLQSVDLIKYYDEVKTELLDNFNENEFNKGYFWTSGKTYVICNQTEPFVFLDLDFVIKEEIPKVFTECDLVHNQWELQRGKFYLSDTKLKNTELPYFYEGMLMPNTSFLLVNNLELLKDYWKLHKHLLNKFGKDLVDESIWLLADQGILAFVIRKHQADVYTLENYIYIENGEFENESIIPFGGVPQYVDFKLKKFQKIKYYHMWIDKNLLLNDTKKRTTYIQNTEKEISKLEGKKKLL